jgi:hypothetical protein
MQQEQSASQSAGQMSPLFGWESDPEAGELVQRYRAGGRPMVESDPRTDVLIDMGVILGEERNEVYYDTEKMQLIRSVSTEYIQYSIYVDDGLVFEVLYTDERGMELGEYLVGPWVYRLAALSRGLRRARRQLARV